MEYGEANKIFLSGFQKETIKFLATEVGSCFFKQYFFRIWRMFIKAEKSGDFDSASY